MNKKDNNIGGGIGVGYVSLIMMFAVICLAVLAVMSYQSAGANDILNEKSEAYTVQYYAADSRVQEKLMLCDNAAYEAAESAFFESSFEEACAAIEGVTLQRAMEGYKVEFTEPINDRSSIKVSAIFYTIPLNGSRDKITTYKTISADEAEEEKPLGVWDGSTFN